MFRYLAERASVPIVAHLDHGYTVEECHEALTISSNICKFDIGTELRMAFGEALRDAVQNDPSRFDRVSILKDTHDPMVAATRTVLSTMGFDAQKG